MVLRRVGQRRVKFRTEMGVMKKVWMEKCRREKGETEN